MRWLLIGLLVPCAVATVIGMVLLYPLGHRQPTGVGLGLNMQPVNGTVFAAASAPCTPDQQGTKPDAKDCLSLTVQLQGGVAAGRSVKEIVPMGPGTPRFAVGDRVVLAYAGSNPTDDGSYQVVDFQRGTPLTVLAVLFAAAVLVLGRWRGLAALAALGATFLVLLAFVLPAIVAGKNPLAVGVVGAGVIMFVVLYLTHGLSARTSTAVLGTLASLALIGGLGTAFTIATKLTGIDDDTSNLMAVLGHGLDAKGLLLAGLMIGALGVLDDVTVTQTSAVWELRRANPALSWRELYAAGLRIGRDHASSAVNTLAMAYAGAALPLLLASSVSGRNFGDIVTSQAVAEEVVRTLVGSIGLLAAIPLTTALAAAVASQETVAGPRDDGADTTVEEATVPTGARRAARGPRTATRLGQAPQPPTNGTGRHSISLARRDVGPPEDEAPTIPGTMPPLPPKNLSTTRRGARGPRTATTLGRAPQPPTNSTGRHSNSPPRANVAPPEDEAPTIPGNTPPLPREDASATRRRPGSGSYPRVVPPGNLPPRRPASPPATQSRQSRHRAGPTYPDQRPGPDPSQR